MSYEPDPTAAARVNEDGEVVDFDADNGDAAFPSHAEELEELLALGGAPAPPLLVKLSTQIENFHPHFGGESAESGPTISCRFPDYAHRLMEVLVNREDVPYRTKTDFIRDAVWGHCQAIVAKLAIHDDEILTRMAVERTRAAAAFAHDQTKTFAQVRHDLHQALLFWVDRGDFHACGRLLATHWDTITKIADPADRNQYARPLAADPLIRCVAIAAISHGFLFPSELLTYAGEWK